ncbi:LysM peptidoglycan-binding domain-containing protein [Solicola gregarius]|uniref:LysM domain-containing protein n=1 Tax=Solicola gregarius TaxID=2908642 RepID=A0AA46TFV5_9ACTN|nr:hypothetical protein [Solicola gregarius]UYM04052.1 hypothetical protein L0C25_16070 [Solicola gregarius]
MAASSRLALGATTAVALAGAACVLAPALAIRPDPGPREFETLVVQLAEVAAFCGCGWLSLATAVTVLAAATGTRSWPARIAVRITPRTWSRVLGLAVGGAVTLVPVAADADDGTAPPPRIVGLRLPDRPAAQANTAASPDMTVVVRRGDTLWRLAAARLPAGADDGAIAHACRRWYAANRGAIGSDPDLLLPGTRLVQPTDDRERKP